MRRVVQRLIAAGIFVLFLHDGASAGTLEDGKAAYKSSDYPAALFIFRPLAEQGNPVAQEYLGRMYFFGRGVPQDEKQAAVWTRKSAEQGDAAAQYELSFMYYGGDGVREDKEQAFSWILKSAEQGDPDSQFQLAMKYEQGDGVPQNFNLAALWLSKSAEQGEPIYQDRLASYYEKGTGVPQDYVRAHMWWNIATAREPDRKMREMFAASRDYIATKMTAAQIAQAQTFATEWTPKSASRP